MVSKAKAFKDVNGESNIRDHCRVYSGSNEEFRHPLSSRTRSTRYAVSALKQMSKHTIKTPAMIRKHSFTHFLDFSWMLVGKYENINYSL
jgi:hypothetical protein